MNYKEENAEQTCGAVCHAREVREFLVSLFARNARMEEAGLPRACACISGIAGIGKTAIVKSFRQDGFQVVAIPISQFEEVADLQGMPELVPVPKVAHPEDSASLDAVGQPTGKHVTRMALPEWVPTEPGPGILLLDDFSRASHRIINAIMQLLQDYEMTSWKLPAGWNIVLTTNPLNSGDYMVQSLDPAVLTRMRHITLRPDAATWLDWAMENSIDERALDFVLMFPEVIEETHAVSRTNPRSLTEFFRCLPDYDDLRANLRKLEIDALASLDQEVARMFLSYVKSNTCPLSAEDILEKFDEKKVKTQLASFMRPEGRTRLDRLQAVCSRLMKAITEPGFTPTARQIGNFQAFLTSEFVPADKLRQVLLEIYQFQQKNHDSKVFKMIASSGELLRKVTAITEAAA